MPAVLPNRPAAGAVIDTVWGQDIHDRTILPKGVIGNGTALVIPASTTTILTISGRQAGNPAWNQPDNQSLKCPIGASGYYLLSLFVTVSGVPVGTYFRLAGLRNGGTFAGASGAYVGIGTYLECSTVLAVADGDLFTAQGWASAANSSWTVNRYTLMRVGDNIAGN